MASATADLEDFVRDGLQRGLPRADIQSAMLTAGWTPEQAKNALSAFAARTGAAFRRHTARHRQFSCDDRRPLSSPRDAPRRNG